MLKKWLPSLIGLSALALVGRLLGFAREILMASKFGATEITDAYLTALILFDIAMAANSSFLSGTLSYSTEIKSLKTFSKSLFNSGLKVFAIVFFCSLILYPITGWLIPLIFSKSPAAVQIVVETSRLLLILAAFLTAGGIFSALLQIKGDITNPGKLIVFLNIGSIVFLIFFSKYMGIISLPLGLLLGGILFFAYQIFLIRRTKFQPSESFDSSKFVMPGWAAVVLLVFGNSLLPSLSGLIERYFAYSFVEGTFSHYQYALKIILLPLTIFGFAISTSLLPIQTRSISIGNEEEFMSATNNGLLISVVTSLFFVLLFSVLSQQIIQLIYQHGNFTLNDSFETSHALQIMALGLIPFLLNPILANIFYSLKAVKNLIAINLFFIIIQIMILFFLSKIFSGIEALTITWVVIGWVNNGSLIYYLVHVKNLHFNQTIILKLSLILLITAAIIILGRNLIGLLFADINIVHDSWSILLRTACSGLLLLLVFGLATYFVFRDVFRKIFTSLNEISK